MALPKLLLTKVLPNMLMRMSTEQLSIPLTTTILVSPKATTSPRATISPRATTSPRAHPRTTVTLRASHMAQTQSVRERVLVW